MKSAWPKPASTSPWPYWVRLGTLDGLPGFGSTPSVNTPSCRTGAVVLHRLVDVGHMRQHLVLDLDQLQRLLCRAGIDRGDRSHRMAVVERLLARHAVVQDVVHARNRHR